jgi:hypothetical protein
VGEKLVQVLVGDCALWKHLEAVEDLYLMRKGDAMSHFVDIVFAKVWLLFFTCVFHSVLNAEIVLLFRWIHNNLGAISTF